MKKIYILVWFSILGFVAEAQDFIPLRIDSSYSFSRSFDLFGVPIEIASFAGYSYNLEDQLVQIRKENERSNFTYTGNQEVETVEDFIDGVWTSTRRVTTTFSGDRPVEIKTEVYPNGFWENSNRITIKYGDNDLVQTQLTEFWVDNRWKNQEKIENIYNVEGNRISQSYFNPDEAGNFIFTFGDRVFYNDNNQPAEIIGLTGNNGGIFFSDKFIFNYNNNQLPDTVIYCFYSFPDTLNCRNLSRSVYSYDLLENRVIRDIDSWSSNNSEWITSRRVETYTGQNIYSELPDSVLTYDYSLPTTDQLLSRRYYVYEELNEEEVLFKSSLFSYDLNFSQFFLKNYREEYYRRGDIVANEEFQLENKITLFPNPVGRNQLLTVKYESTGVDPLEIYIFDSMGQLLSQQKTGSNPQFTAPNTPGIYFIQIKNEKGIVLLQKLSVH